MVSTKAGVGYAKLDKVQDVGVGLAGAGLCWLSKMADADKWNLSSEEVADLLGGMPVRTYHDLKKKARMGQPITLPRDTLERISLLLGIWKGLQIIAPMHKGEVPYQWFRTPNSSPIFEGKSIKEYLLDRKSIEALYTVRRYLDAARG